MQITLNIEVPDTCDLDTQQDIVGSIQNWLAIEFPFAHVKTDLPMPVNTKKE